MAEGRRYFWVQVNEGEKHQVAELREGKTYLPGVAEPLASVHHVGPDVTWPLGFGRGVVRIPDITDEKIAEMLKDMRPVASKDGKLWYIKPVDPRTVGYTWDPKLVREATRLREVYRLHTFHTWAFYGFFKPTVAEVLAQVQHRFDMGYRWNAFETFMHLDGMQAVVDDNHHIATSVFYYKEPK